ncbi:TonB-dependent receptor plug domain-containing protein [Silanimonas lenta]|uniref:TonB-dependent receptor plug domain-containing protein n=1 Tax=Silanimonas lenta TaxID=265429 RepID=UPI0004224470|nr:TonB-dependent receptor [Silanimonas lenta]
MRSKPSARPVRHALASAIRLGLCSAALCISSLPAQAQTPESTAKTEDAKTLDAVIVSTLGSRGQPRSENLSAVPIDIIGGADFHNQGTVDVLDQMRVLVPSFQVSIVPIDDAATLVRPANLRGLPPDSSLVLVNGKRRHRSAVITFLGHGLSDGSQGPDISTIPSLALEQVEVLRDGAAAQYGSDAIAGVINFNLKRLTEGGSVEAFLSQTYEGDGQNRQLAAQLGTKLTEDGFATLTAEWRDADPTSRSVQRPDAAAAAAAGYPGVPDPAQIWGSPRVNRDFKFVANLGLSYDRFDYYLFGNIASRDVDGGFYYRNPTSRAGVYSFDGGNTLAIGNLGGPACPTIALRDSQGNLIPYNTVSSQVNALPSHCFTFLRLLPGGFTPRFGGIVRDSSLVAGMKGEWLNGIRFDFSASRGRSEVDFYLLNTINASLGPNQPADRRFRPGSNIQTETNFNADFVKEIDTGFTVYPMNLAAGLEWRKEEFEIINGDQASFEVGPLASQGFLIGSNGFPGFNPRQSGVFSRSNWAAYLDAEANFTERLLVQAAARYEDFEDFGSTANGKLTARFETSDSVALRAAASTGFRAPTPGQSNITQVTTQFINGELRDAATLAPTNPISQRFGGRQLQPEESDNLSAGVVFSEGPWLVTLDLYRIKVRDRIALTGNFALTDADRAALLAQGVTDALSYSTVRFFTNDFDTSTRGVDLVASYDTEQWGGTTTYSLAVNWNRTKVDRYNPDVTSEARVFILENSLPKTKGNFNVHHRNGNWHVNLRLSYYGSFFEDHLDTGFISGPDALPIYGDAAWIVDAEVGYRWANGFFANLGAQNLFDKYPDENPWADVVGARYPSHTPFGFNGGVYYLRAGYRF